MSTPANDLNIQTAGYVVFDGTATFTGRTFQAGPGITLTNASGVAGNTTIGLGGTAAPFVNAYLNTPVTNITGNGTNYQIIYDTSTADSTSSYNNATGVFTAPITGNYFVTATVTYTSVDSTFTVANLAIATSLAGITNLMTTQNPGKLFNVNNNYTHTITCNVGLTAGATMSIQTLVSGGTKTVGLQGVSSGNWSYLNIAWINP